LVDIFDEPFADDSMVPTFFLTKLARQHMTVALSGDGGDELFAGYDRYRAVQMAARIDRLPRFVKSMLTARLWQSLPASVRQQSWRRRLKRLLLALGEPPEARYLRWINIFDPQLRQELYTDEFRAELGSADVTRFLLDAYAGCGARDFVTRTTCADVLTYLPCDILHKVDMATMAYSLECRSPFLDHHVAELAARMPLELKISGNRGKRVLLETFREFLPPAIQKRRKMGFGVPLDHWFRGELKPLLQEILLDRRSLDRGYFNEKTVRRLIDEHISASWDHSYRLWSLLVFEIWQRMYLDAPSAPSACPASI
jgi:asparagine synthase (glutamine-hydrolysing)